MIYASAVLIDEGRRAQMKHQLSRDPWLACHFDFMRHVMREMSRMFEGFPGAGGSNHSLTSWPPIEVTERDNRVVIPAEMPGMRREGVKVRPALMEGRRSRHPYQNGFQAIGTIFRR